MKNELTYLLEQEIENLGDASFSIDFEEDFRFRSPNRKGNKYHGRKMGNKSAEVSTD